MSGADALPAALHDPVVLGGLAGLAIVLIGIWRAAVRSAKAAAPLSQEVDRLTRRIAEMEAGQNRVSGGLTQVMEAQSRAQAATTASVERRLEEVSRKMGDSLHGSATRTARSLGELHERLETIDRAQSNIEKLSGDVLGLQDILSNKQARGAFGEIQLASIVEAALPPDAFSLQATLSNGKRADCLIHMAVPPGPIVVDSKFPLEPYEALVAAETDAERAQATRDMRMAFRRHIRAISEKYIISGETAESALMFVPSEAVYAELHARYSEIVREGFAARVWLVSPTTCMAVLNTLRSVLKDVRMREQAGEIRRELSLLHADVGRLSDRVDALDTHFNKAAKDVAEIRISAEKSSRRAHRLEHVDFGDSDQEATAAE